MIRKDNNNYEMLTGVVDFTTRNVGLLANNSAAGEIVNALGNGVKILSEAAAARKAAEAAIREANAVRIAAKEDLKDLLGRFIALRLAIVPAQ